MEELFPTSLINDPSQAAELVTRAILSPHNATVDSINSDILNRVVGDVQQYNSVDTPANDDPYNVPLMGPETFHGVTPSGFPLHRLDLKVGSMVMLLRNLDVDAKLNNGARLIIVKMHTHGVLCRFAEPTVGGEDHVFISPLYFKHVDKNGAMFSFVRRQLPLRLAYAMTINKSQGQTLEKMGLFLNTNCFSHGQLYVALSRVRAASALHVYIPPDPNHPTRAPRMFNVVCSAMFPPPTGDNAQALHQQDQEGGNDVDMEANADGEDDGIEDWPERRQDVEEDDFEDWPAALRPGRVNQTTTVNSNNDYGNQEVSASQRQAIKEDDETEEWHDALEEQESDDAN